MSSKVSIVIPCYFHTEEVQNYLDLCIKSCKAQTYNDIEIVVSSSGDKAPIVPEGVKLVHSFERLHFPKCVNQGVRATSPDSKYLFILNDDTCLTKTCTEEMVNTIGDGEMVANPLSNCDNMVRYNMAVGFFRNDDFVPVPVRFMRLNQIVGDEDNFINSKSIYPRGTILQNWLAIYATMIPRKVWDKVGEIDENFKTGQDDLDWCLRAKKHNIPTVVAINALAWHFGGVTSSVVLDQKTRQHNFEYFIKKWGMRPEQAGI